MDNSKIPFILMLFFRNCIFTGRQWWSLDGTKCRQKMGASRHSVPWHQMRLPRHAWCLHANDLLQAMDRKSVWAPTLSSKDITTPIYKPITYKQSLQKIMAHKKARPPMSNKCKAQRPNRWVDLGLSTLTRMSDLLLIITLVSLVQNTRRNALKHSLASS